MAMHAHAADEEPPMAAGELATPVDDRIRELVDSRAAAIESRIAELEAELEQLDSFAKITLRDRRIAENTANLGKVSDTLSGFAENTTDKLNAQKSAHERNTLLLAALVEALDAEGIDLDLAAVRDHREGRPVTGAAADDRLNDALDR